MIYFFSEGARVEFLEQIAFYEERRQGLGARFLAGFDTAIARACEHPERFPSVHPAGIRRIAITGFPFNILYRVSRGEIEVLAIAAHARRPGYWLGRG